MSRDETRQLVINALQGDAQSIEALVDRLEGTPAPGAEDVAVAAAKARVDYLHAMAKPLEEHADLLEDDPKIRKAIDDCNNTLRADPKFAGVPDAALSAYVLQLGRKKFGTETERYLAEEQARRRGLPPPDPFAREVREEEPDEFERERNAGVSEAIAEMRRGRAGVPLEEIRRRRARANVTAETDE